jgi:hypothetical protein
MIEWSGSEEVATHLGKRAYSVWIEDGLEANDYYLTLEEAIVLKAELKLDGYDSEIVNMKEAG